MSRDLKAKTSMAASLDQKDNLIKVEESKLDDVMTNASAKQRLYEAAETLRPPGYKHSGSVAIHFYFSELSGVAFVNQVQLGKTSEYASALGFNKLFHAMRRSHGYDQTEKN